MYFEEVKFFHHLFGKTRLKVKKNKDIESLFLNNPFLASLIFEMPRVVQRPLTVEETLQNCKFDNNGKFENQGGICIGDCGPNKELFVYDWNEGCCITKLKTM